MDLPNIIADDDICKNVAKMQIVVISQLLMSKCAVDMMLMPLGPGPYCLESNIWPSVHAARHQ